MVRSPAWVRDELILACDLVAQNGWRELRQGDPRVRDLSELLRSLPLHSSTVRTETFRSSDSVSRKTTDIATHHPGYTGKKTRGGALDVVVLDDFLTEPAEMHQLAQTIRDAARLGHFDTDVAAEVELLDDDEPAREGRLMVAVHRRRERDAKLRNKKVAEFLRANDRIFCEICEFDFELVYGVHGKGYIECHHVVPLHVSGETKTRTEDLVLLCANCHRMIHRQSRWLQPAELRDLVKAGGR
ncbi:HNH endonuclease [Nocardia sp. NBC_01327]|uniref:HNH endonuclease n=1 Tax=Nocardia sp. NBC_01327 TaxID=2903593 RepID=UPI002E14153A|nr:HNH endonuclease [Nocardia sp. NBC_01327]